MAVKSGAVRLRLFEVRVSCGGTPITTAQGVDARKRGAYTQRLHVL